MTKTRLLSIVAIALLTPLSFAGVEIEHDAENDFARYRTFAWKPGKAAARPDVQRWIVTAVERELEAKGLRGVPEGHADLYVVTHVFKEMDSKTRGNYFHLNRANIGVITSDVVAMTKGVLIIELVDGESERSVWQGMASDVMDSPGPDKLRKKIDKASRKLLRHFPPR